MTKYEAIALFKNAAELARALKISRSAVSQWPDTGDIPREHELTIRHELKPEVFGRPCEPTGRGSGGQKAA